MRTALRERAAAEAAAAEDRADHDRATGEAYVVHGASTAKGTTEASTAHQPSKPRPRPRPRAKARTIDEVDATTDEAHASVTQADEAADAMARITAALNEVGTSMSAEAQGRPHRKKIQTPAGEAITAQNAVKILKASKAAEAKAKRLAQAQRSETTAAKKTSKAKKPKSKKDKK